MLTPPSPSEVHSSPIPPVMVECYLLIRPEKIGWLRFIVEGYDGLAMVSTVAAIQGLVRIQTLDCRFSEAMHLIAALAADLTPYPARPTAIAAPNTQQER